MIIVDSRADKIKRIIIIILVAATIIVAAWLAISFFERRAEEKKISSQEAGKRQGDNGENRSVSETEAEFDQDRKACLEFFSGLENADTEAIKTKEKEIVEADIEKAKYYYFCLSLKNNNEQYCDALKSNEDAFKNCQQRFSFFSNFFFPALKTNSCDSKFIDACKNAGGSDCESSCRGLILKEAGECEKIAGSAAVKSACLAINKKDDAIACNSSNEDDRKSCQELFYFLKAIRENNASYINKIEHAAFRPIAQLFFDSNSQCEKILAGFGENACNKKYTQDYLRELEGQAGQQQNIGVK
jgi:hypothetical protein